MGWLEDEIKKRLGYLLNPVQWLVHCLELPGRILAVLGVVSQPVGEGRFLRLLTLVSLIVTILAAWDPATAFLRAHHLLP